ncbi:MAG TPA: patatin-like phospholipase family protein [Candidatus Angelobacter sp.]|nr:patatin-like phospholipase family protein [Candidatus Angelobacter sp.]
MSSVNTAASYSLGIALSGGGFRGMAHIGVLGALERHGLKPDFIAGTSAGSLVGALYASGKSAANIESLASKIFWPKLLSSRGLADFCRDNLPRTFAELAIPLSVVVTALPSKALAVLDSGELAPAIAASCAMPWLLRRIKIENGVYMDGGCACVLPAKVCRDRGCQTVISSDVWWRASVARKSGFTLNSRFAEQVYSCQYIEAFRKSDLVIHPRIPAAGIVPGRRGMHSLIQSGEAEAEKALAGWQQVVPA